jgi:DNA-binding transcriptional ArsR family regulator
LPKPHSSRTTADLAGSASVFAALGDETRLRLISRLCDDGPLSIAALTTGFPITRQAITKHLRVMEDAGLVRSAQRGRDSVWQVEQKRLADARRHLQQISTQWDETLDRLKRFVERQAEADSGRTTKRG